MLAAEGLFGSTFPAWEGFIAPGIFGILLIAVIVIVTVVVVRARKAKKR